MNVSGSPRTPRHSRSVRAAEWINQHSSARARAASIIVVLALLALAGIAALAASAQAYPPLRPGVVKVDTGTGQEDDQPAWTARLARHGWDYNPACDQQGARFDWFAPGQPCNARPVLVSGVGSARIVGVV